MKKVLIVGCNSKLYKGLKNTIRTIGEVVEISHRDIDLCKGVFDLVIVFSFDTCSFENNMELIAKAYDKNIGKLIYISTSAIFANVFHHPYRYPKLKKEIELEVLQRFECCAILRVGIFADSKRAVVHTGTQNLTTNSMFSRGLQEACEPGVRIVNAFENIEKEESRFREFLLRGYLALASTRLGSMLNIGVDVVLKLLGKKQYGYTLLSNRGFALKATKKVVVGAGLTAYGHMIKNADNSVICLSPGKDYLSKRAMLDLRSLEVVGKGGNSDRWHGVISRLSNYSYTQFEDSLWMNYLSKLYNLGKSDVDLIFQGFSFIPKRPLRPNNLNTLIGDGCFEDSFCVAVQSRDDGLKIHTSRGEITCDEVVLACGSLIGLDVLSRSGYLKKPVSFDDHMVGYFGQVTLSRKQKLNSQKRKSGHFKKYQKIKLSCGDAFLALRPAYGSFKKLEKASKYRSFFAKDSKGIITSLFLRLRLPLIGEALFNKYGYSLSTNTFNIVGHIEMRDNCIYTPSSTKRLKYKKSEVILSKEDADLIRDVFSHLGILQCKVLDKVFVDPGIHYVGNGNFGHLLPKGLTFESTLGLPSSVEHPTFTQFIKSLVR